MATGPAEEQKGGGRKADAASRVAARRAAKAAAKAAKRGTAPLMAEAVADGVDTAQSWYGQNSRVVWTGLGMGTLLALGWLSIGAHMQKSAHETAALLESAVDAALAPIVGTDNPTPDAEDAEESFGSASERAEQAIKRFEAVVARDPDGPATSWARIGHAAALLELGKAEEARKLYAQVLDGADDDIYLRWRGLAGLGFALEALGKQTEAAKRFEELAALEGGAFRPLGDYHRARMLVAEGKRKEAADLLKSLSEDEAKRPPEQGARFESVMADVATLMSELGVGEKTGNKLSAQLPPVGPEGGGNPALTQEIIDALRKQMDGAGAGEKRPGGLSNDIVDALQKNVEAGGGGAKTIQIPLGNKPEAPEPPAGEEAAPEAAPEAADEAQ
ncbi:MAG: tetratricopeptide repeat protein [Myxococcales bacterium]|nr:tetratricopeptide repeat protein [Myxococcales bacterium]